MSAILGIFDSNAQGGKEGTAQAMISAMEARGNSRSEVRRVGDAVLAASRWDWEMETGFSGPVDVVKEGDLAIAADASLYYRDDLIHALRSVGEHPRGNTASQLILAAYRAWGTACTDRLEGDWAFILWDGRHRRVFCARDFGGKRPLFYAEPQGMLLVGSTIAGLLAHPKCPSDLNLTSIAADAAGFFAAAYETAYRSISLLPAGFSLVRESGAARVDRHWTPPPMHVNRTRGFDRAAEELRALLERAVAERLPPSKSASVWLSGGWDSTAVFGAGEQVLRAIGSGQHLHAVSLSYPPEDPGREDELIEAVVKHTGSPVKWLDVAQIPLLDEPEQRAAVRNEPFAHAFEMGNRALAAGSRHCATRVAFDGSGGDQLFQVTQVYLADLFRTLRWLRLRQEWHLKRLTGTGARNFFRWAVQPILPRPLRSAAVLLRGGRPLLGYLDRPIPQWIDPDFIQKHRLIEREEQNTPIRRGGSRADYETFWYITHPYFSRAFAAVATFALEAGVELRSPLYDRRIVEFALSRPREERSSGAETKRLLRHAMRGLLPEQVLAPRPFRTGTSGGYLDHSLRKQHAELINSIFMQPLALADFGVVDADVLRSQWQRFLQRGGGNLGVNLFLTLQVELWLRARH